VTERVRPASLRWPGGCNENQTTSSQPFIVAPQHNCKPKDDAAPATFSAAPHFVGEPTIAEVVEDLGFELIFDAAEMIESFAISLREASFRRDRAEVCLHLRRLRLALNAAIQTQKEMSGQGTAAP
jgi:hypothetical protein